MVGMLWSSLFKFGTFESNINHCWGWMKTFYLELRVVISSWADCVFLGKILKALLKKGSSLVKLLFQSFIKPKIEKSRVHKSVC
jgi:hypothetical protein